MFQKDNQSLYDVIKLQFLYRQYYELQKRVYFKTIKIKRSFLRVKICVFFNNIQFLIYVWVSDFKINAAAD